MMILGRNGCFFLLVGSFELLLLLLAVPFASSEEFCVLCEDGVAGLKRPHYNTDSRGKTCVKLALETALMETPGSDDCADIIDDFREICCGDEEPSPIEQAPTSSPVSYTGPMGDYPACPICYDETYPSNPSMVINILGIGADSCRMYYDYGRRGLIRTELCDTLQSFAYEPCGCGVLDSKPDDDSFDGSDSDSPDSILDSLESLFECFASFRSMIGRWRNG